MKKILIPVDFNPLGSAALRYAALLAERSGALLIVMYADTFEPPVEFTAAQTAALATSIEDSRRRAGEELERYVHEQVPEMLAMRTEVREALPLPGILAAIREHEPDLLVMGTHGRGGLSRLMYGSVTEAVLRDTNIPVLTINRVDAARSPRNILCVATGGERSDAPQRAAAELATMFDAQCRTVAVRRESSAEILASPEAATADLIVIGEEIHAITRHAACPVLHVTSAESS